MYFRQVWNKSRSWLALLLYVVFNMKKKSTRTWWLLLPGSNLFLILQMISCFLLSEISSEHMKFKSLNIFFSLWPWYAITEISTFVIYFKKASALYQLGRVTLIGFMVHKCPPCPRWKAAAARKRASSVRGIHVLRLRAARISTDLLLDYPCYYF